ncbi:PaaI family thioesterase [Putridiphycobacter roseus]|uniref:PaaI family thioesterase n=1 Tax=Putridiphycobacter roseus TaxID=2219161 RepID=A0A2W1N1J2_9FLAO|nr:PaaI family thioesterase [Putridiphycobacter roseus]PZE16811.1 PaaI family thioesterase [Putridiphycobacter roseus]
MEGFIDNLIAVYQKTNQFGRENGMELLSYEAGKIKYKLVVQQKHLATPTTSHGGLIAGYMDGIMGVAALTESAKNLNLVSTVEFKINYLKPAFLGDVLIGNGKVISAGKRIIIAQGEIILEKTGELIAVATGTFNAYPYQKSGMVV